MGIKTGAAMLSYLAALPNTGMGEEQKVSEDGK